jgi:4-hydroxybenzoate polyprenyltransferase
MMRPDHWAKTVFVLSGILVALMFDPSQGSFSLVSAVVLGLIALCFATSSNYVMYVQ